MFTANNEKELSAKEEDDDGAENFPIQTHQKRSLVFCGSFFSVDFFFVSDHASEFSVSDKRKLFIHRSNEFHESDKNSCKK